MITVGSSAELASVSWLLPELMLVMALCRRCCCEQLRLTTPRPPEFIAALSGVVPLSYDTYIPFRALPLNPCSSFMGADACGSFTLYVLHVDAPAIR